MTLYSLYLLPLFFASLFCISAAAFAWRHREFPAVGYFIALMGLSAGWALFYGLSIGTTDVPLRILFTNWMYLFTRLIPPIAFCMVMDYTGHDQWLKSRRIALLLVIPVIAISASVTSPIHHLFRWDFVLDTTNTIPVLRYRGGIIYQISSMFGDSLSLVSIFTLILSFRDKALPKINTALILTGMLIPVIVNILFTVGITPISGYSFAPTSLIGTAACYLLALVGFRMFTFTPIARTTAMEHIEDIVVVFDSRNQIVDFNPIAARTCGLDKKRHMGRTAEALGGEWGAFFRDSLSNDDVREEMTVDIGGQRCTYELRLAVIRDSIGRPRGKMLLLHDITLLRTLLKEKELLLKEVHHRVKNNMMVISSILSLQADTIESVAAKEALQEARGRIQSMTLLYERIYRAENLSAIGLEEYLSPLVDKIVASVAGTRRIEISKDIEATEAPPQMLFMLGIILNELISNALKHAFIDMAPNTVPTLGVAVQKTTGALVLSIHDNGRGLPSGFTLENSGGFGLQLVETMLRQVSGNLSISKENGTTFRLSIPFPFPL